MAKFLMVQFNYNERTGVSKLKKKQTESTSGHKYPQLLKQTKTKHSSRGLIDKQSKFSH